MKIRPLSELKDVGGILCHGCFDLIHIGHIRHLTLAKQLLPEDFLTVTITADRFITKGPGRPAFTEAVRAEWLAALECVDFVSVVEDHTGIPAILTVKPAIYVKGVEYKEIKPVHPRDRGLEEVTFSENAIRIIEKERDAVESIGGRIAFTESNEGFSSSSILSGSFLRQRAIVQAAQTQSDLHDKLR